MIFFLLFSLSVYFIIMNYDECRNFECPFEFYINYFMLNLKSLLETHCVVPFIPRISITPFDPNCRAIESEMKAQTCERIADKKDESAVQNPFS